VSADANAGPPETIYLQYYGDADPEDFGPDEDPIQSGEVTFCREQIFEHDIVYVRRDLVRAMKRRES
jgi:hypothetical protein